MSLLKYCYYAILVYFALYGFEYVSGVYWRIFTNFDTAYHSMYLSRVFAVLNFAKNTFLYRHACVMSVMDISRTIIWLQKLNVVIITVQFEIGPVPGGARQPRNMSMTTTIYIYTCIYMCIYMLLYIHICFIVVYNLPSCLWNGDDE